MSKDVDDLTIETIDWEIARGFKTLLFSPALERRFEAGRQEQRVRSFIRNGLLGTLLYDLFLFSDAQMIPDVFCAAVIARLCVFTPLSLLGIFVASRTRSLRLREGVSAALVMMSVLLTMSVLTLTHDPDTTSYQYGTVLIMLFSAMVNRLRIRYTITCLLGSLMIQLVALAHLSVTSPRVFQSQVLFFVTAGILMAVSAYFLEHEQRIAYLLGLRGAVLNAQLDQAAKVDPLTGIGNRRYLAAVMETVLAQAGTSARSVSAVLLDIDHFKLFNDAYGHQAGDLCLRQIGECVRFACASFAGATAIRFGGEEFLVFLDGADTSVARLMARHIQSLIQTKAIAHPELGRGAILTASIGIASIQTGRATFEDLIAAADKALYTAKNSGRNCISIASAASSLERADAPNFAIAS